MSPQLNVWPTYVLVKLWIVRLPQKLSENYCSIWIFDAVEKEDEEAEHSDVQWSEDNSNKKPKDADRPDSREVVRLEEVGDKSAESERCNNTPHKNIEAHKIERIPPERCRILEIECTVH